MNTVTFTRAAGEGYRSLLRPFNFPLDRKGVNLLRGYNGAGKTSLLEGIMWTLYKMTLKGKSITKVATWEELRDKSWRGTRFIVEFNTGGHSYKVVRHLKFKGTTCGLPGKDTLMIFRKPVSDEREYCDIDLVGDEQHKGDQEAYLVRVIGVDGKAFSSSVLFGQRMSRLVDSDNEDKRQLFDQLFDVCFVGIARDKAKARLGVLDIELETLNGDLRVLNQQAEAETQRYEREKKLLDDWVEQQAIKKKELNSSIQHVQVTIVSALFDLENAIKANDAVPTPNKDALVEEEVQLYTKISNLREEMDQKREAKRKEVVIKQQEHEVLVKAAKASLQQAEQAAEDKQKEVRAKGAEADDIDRSIQGYEVQAAECDIAIAALEQELLEVNTNCPYCGTALKLEKIDPVKKAIQEKITREQQAKRALLDKVPLLEQELREVEAIEADLKSQHSVLLDAIDQAKKEYETVLNRADLISDEYANYKHAAVDVNWMAKYENDYSIVKSKLAATTTDIARKLTLENQVITAKEALKDKEMALLSLKERLKDLEGTRPPEIDLEAIKAEKERILVKRGVVMVEQMVKQEERSRVVWWIDKGFSASGLKAFVFNAMLNRLNHYAEKYAGRLGTRVKFSVDLSKASKPFTTTCYVNGLEKDYDDFSGGEKQRVDVVLAFAMYDLVGHRIKTNLLIMDEIFEGLDTDGVETVFDLIRVKAEEGKAVYVVTHSTTIDSMYCKHVIFEKSPTEGTIIRA